jgi:predicted ATPase with chaperone activity
LPRIEIVTVEADISSGLPYFATVGLPEKIVRESKDRANNKAALQNTGYPFPANSDFCKPRPRSSQKGRVGI